ncbi:MAG: type VI secretion system-associated FHA domain protein TagH [Pseudomonadota bacterium]
MSSIKIVLRRSDDPSQRSIDERLLSGALIRIGRRPPPAELGERGYWQIDDKSISRTHCEIFSRGHDLFISDLGSTNGTTVGGQRLEPQQPVGISPGDSAVLGELFILTIEVVAETTGPVIERASGPFGQETPSSPFEPGPASNPFASPADTNASAPFPSAAAPSPAPSASPARGAGFQSSGALNGIFDDKKPSNVTPRPVPQDTGGSTLDQVVSWEPNIGSLSTDIPVDWDGGGAASQEEDPFGTAAAAQVEGAEKAGGEGDLWGEGSGADGSTSRDDKAPSMSPAAPLEAKATLSSFLEGANLPLSSFADGDHAGVLKRAGEIYRQAVLNYAQFLMNRDKVKEEYQVERTQIGAQNNSPLKFLPAEQAAEHMLKEPMPGFLDGPAAFRDASLDIKRHQVGLMAGTRAALEALLAEVERAAEAQQSSGIKLPFGGKQPSDETLVGVLARLREEFQGNGRGVVFEAFRSAYDRVTQEGED